LVELAGSTKTASLTLRPERVTKLLSNGTRSRRYEPGPALGEVGRPVSEPAYLVAMVAAKLDRLEDSFVTRSGRKVKLAVFVEPGKLDQCRVRDAA